MKILGLDPGKTTGVAFWEPGKGLLYETLIPPPEKHPFDALNVIHHQLEQLVCLRRPDLIAIERVVAGSRSLDSNQSNFWPVGVFIVAGCVAQTYGKDFVTYAASTVKKCSTGSGRAKKRDVVMWVNQRFNLTLKVKDNHMADAIAVAYTAWTKAQELAA